MNEPSRRRSEPRASGSVGAELVNAALLIAAVTVVARIIGFVRVVVLARTVGTECLGRVYATANAVPNIVFELVVGGALAAVVVPLIAGAREADPARVRAMVAALHGWALVLLVPITATMYVASTWVIGFLLGSADDCGSEAPTVARAMLWVFLLQIPIYGATVVAQGALQSHRRFFAPAVAPAVSSLLVLASYLAYAEMAGPARGSLVALSDAEFLLLAGGTTLGVVALLAVQLPGLARAGLIVRPSLTFPAGKWAQARTLAWSGAVVVGVQWVGYAAAVRWSNIYGSQVSALVLLLGWTLFLLPWSILVLPIATSTFPRLSALHERGDDAAAARTTAQSVRAVFVASAIGAAGLAAAAGPLAVVILQDAPGGGGVAELTALLIALAVGVFGYGVHGHLVRVLAARHQAPMAAWGTTVGWGLGILVAGVLAVRSDDGVEVARAIGVGFSSGLVVGAAVLLVALRRLAGSQALTGVLRVGVASGLAAVVVGWLGHILLTAGSGETSLGVAVAQTLMAGCVALVIVGGTAALADPGAVRTLLRMRSRSGDGPS
ncbi:MAG: virulence factor MviN [Actinomycetia bacterium]|nr:virulence factor MviN [Actinomycetes bacterium]